MLFSFKIKLTSCIKLSTKLENQGLFWKRKTLKGWILTLKVFHIYMKLALLLD